MKYLGSDCVPIHIGLEIILIQLYYIDSKTDHHLIYTLF